MVRCAVTWCPRLVIRMTDMLTLDKPTHDSVLFDEVALVADLKRLADQHAGSEQDLRRAVAQRLKAVLAEGRGQAEQLLLKDRQGRRCAERLCFMTDEVIRILFEFVTTNLLLTFLPRFSFMSRAPQKDKTHGMLKKRTYIKRFGAI